jgi:adenine-specific DNA-methyltransferase
MIIQGDNLAALKSLLPYYAGQIECIFIDPPYNAGTAFDIYDDSREISYQNLGPDLTSFKNNAYSPLG